MAGEQALDVSSRQSLVAGLVKTCFPLDVCTFATRITPSVPLITSTILARGYWPLGFNSSVMTTMSSTASASVLGVHFFRAVSDGTYSLSHRFQKWSTIYWLSWNCRSVVWVMVLVDFNEEYGLAPAWRKWLGVSGSGTSGSTLRWVKGPVRNSSNRCWWTLEVMGLTDVPATIPPWL